MLLTRLIVPFWKVVVWTCRAFLFTIMTSQLRVVGSVYDIYIVWCFIFLSEELGRWASANYGIQPMWGVWSEPTELLKAVAGMPPRLTKWGRVFCAIGIAIHVVLITAKLYFHLFKDVYENVQGIAACLTEYSVLKRGSTCTSVENKIQ